MARYRKPSPPYDYVIEDRGYTTPCHIWQRGFNKKGYGVTHVRAPERPAGWVTRAAHIVAFEEKYGPVPPGKELDHLCRIRPCRNPDHVEPVTHAENCRRGAGCKLNASTAAAIRASAESAAVLAEEYGVTIGQIQRVLTNKDWRDSTKPITSIPHPRTISTEIRQAIRADIGVRSDELARKYGLNQSTINRIRGRFMKADRAAGEPPRNPKKQVAWTAERIALAEKLHAEGVTYAELGPQFGVDRCTVARAINRHSGR